MADMEINQLVKEIAENGPYKIVLSGGRGEYRKVVFERKIIGGRRCYQIGRYTEKQVFHENIDEDSLENVLAGQETDRYRQLNAFATGQEWDAKISKKGKVSVNRRQTDGKMITVSGNNRKKKYILEEGMDIPVKGLDVHITGLDLKEQVINDCNDLAEKFGYTGLRFELGDINGYKTDVDVDMVMTLHACDVATDYALYNAICWNAQYILSVPCCQHELNKQMHTDGFAALTRYGIIKERFAALATDSIRGLMLEACGYKTDIMEFIDIAHSPKNLLIRAAKKNVSQDKKNRSVSDAENLCREFGVRQTLMDMLREDGRV